MKTVFDLNGKRLDLSQHTLIIAEVAQAHDGSLGIAHAFIDAVATTGADAIKFQTHLAEFESSLQEPWRVRFSYEDPTRYDYWKRMEFTLEQWLGLKKHAEEKGLIFISSPFSPESVAWLEQCEMPIWKIASGEVNNFLLYEAIVKTGKPVILSSGMSSLADLDQSVEFFRKQEIPVLVMQCTTDYPCPPERIGIQMIPALRERYDCLSGLSDHSGSIVPSLAAATLGASLIEVHVTFSQDMFGPDVSSSVTINELKQLVDGVRMIEKMRDESYSKDKLAAEKTGTKTIFGKSLVARVNLKRGDKISLDNVSARKPLIGVPVEEIYSNIGKVCLQDIAANEFILPSSLGDTL